RHLTPGFALRRQSPRRRQSRLPGDERGDVAVAHLIRSSVLVEIGRASPAGAEALYRLEAMMVVHGIDGELPQRGHDALLAEGADDKIHVDAFELLQVDDAVRMNRQPSEIDAFRGNRDTLAFAAFGRAE